METQILLSDDNQDAVFEAKAKEENPEISEIRWNGSTDAQCPVCQYLPGKPNWIEGVYFGQVALDFAVYQGKTTFGVTGGKGIGQTVSIICVGKLNVLQKHCKIDFLVFIWD